MTIEEAIRIMALEREDWETSHCTPYERKCAFDMAINALKAQEVSNDSPELDKENGELISNKRTETHACDLIDRQAVIDEINKHSVLLEYHVPHTFHELKDAIKHLPSAQPDLSGYSDKLWKAAYERGKAEAEPQWIPCSERLPEDEQNVLVTYKTTDKIHPCQYHDDGSRNPWYSYIDQCRAHMNVVLAWMPLPECYRGENDGRAQGD